MSNRLQNVVRFTVSLRLTNLYCSVQYASEVNRIMVPAVECYRGNFRVDNRYPLSAKCMKGLYFFPSFSLGRYNVMNQIISVGN